MAQFFNCQRLELTHVGISVRKLEDVAGASSHGFVISHLPVTSNKKTEAFCWQLNV